MADAPAPIKIADIHEDGVFIALEDGRHVAATVKDGVEGLRRGTKVKITSDGLDKDGAPKDAVVVGVAS